MLSLIIPCFNEQENLKKLLKKLNFLLGTYSNEKIELVLVDNGSTDSSREIIKKSDLYLNNKINLVKIDNNIGYGNGVYNGIKSSKGDFIAWFHADLQTNPSDVMNIFELSKKKLLDEDCVIKGKRTNRSLIDIFFTFGMSIFTFLLFGKKINDINAQPKIFKKNFFNKLKNAPDDFSFDVFFLLMAKKENLQIYEYPIVWHKRYAGEAKGGGSIKLKIKLTLRTIKYMIQLKKNTKWN